MFKKKIHIENAVRKLRFNNNEMTQQQLAEDLLAFLDRPSLQLKNINTHHH